MMLSLSLIKPAWKKKRMAGRKIPFRKLPPSCQSALQPRQRNLGLTIPSLLSWRAQLCRQSFHPASRLHSSQERASKCKRRQQLCWDRPAPFMKVGTKRMSCI